MDIRKPHDSFFKQLMTDPVLIKDFIKSVLPKDLVKFFDLDSLKIIDTEKTNRKYKKYYLDISAECKLQDKDSEVYIVFEHKSYADKLTLIQILNYFSVVWEEDLRAGRNPKPIIPIIFYHGKAKFGLPVKFSEYFNVSKKLKKYLLDFEVQLFDTNAYENEELLKFSDNMYLIASLLMFKNIFKNIDEMKPVLKRTLEIETEKGMLILDYFLMARDIKEDELNELIKEIGGDKMPSLAQRWLEQGKQEGLQQGLQQGLHKGLQQGIHQTIIEAIELKFGTVPEKTKEMITNIYDNDKLKSILKIILQAETIDELFKIDN